MGPIRAFLGASARAAIELVAPPRCASCDAPVPRDEPFCGACEPEGVPHGRIDHLETGLAVVSTGLYEGALAAAVQRLKYGSRPDLAVPLGERLGRALTALVGDPHAHTHAGRMPVLLVPVPLHPRRLAERGYNQSALVARAAARATSARSARHAPWVLARTRVTSEQAALGRLARLANVEAAFAVRASVHARDVVVIDDVVTTGATALACAAALSRGGARVLAVAAIARADRATAAPTTALAPSPRAEARKGDGALR